MVNKDDIINSVRLHKGVDALIREYGYRIKPVKKIKFTSIIESKKKEVIGYMRSHYVDDFLTPRIYIASLYRKKTENMVNALKLINVEVKVQPTQVIVDMLKELVASCKMME